MNTQKLNITKPIVSVNEICHKISLSRSRFYQLLDSGFFPKPKYDERSNRPYFDAALQKQILESRNSGIGADGSYMLFYSPRKIGFLFSAKAARASTRSFVGIVTSYALDSSGRATPRLASMP